MLPNGAGWRALFPPAQWIPQYQPGWLRRDVAAAPMETVIDMHERDRTEQLSAPVRPMH